MENSHHLLQFFWFDFHQQQYIHSIIQTSRFFSSWCTILCPDWRFIQSKSLLNFPKSLKLFLLLNTQFAKNRKKKQKKTNARNKFILYIFTFRNTNVPICLIFRGISVERRMCSNCVIWLVSRAFSIRPCSLPLWHHQLQFLAPKVFLFERQ